MQGQGTCLPVAVWFLFDQEGRPLGQVYRGRDKAVPREGEVLEDGGAWRRAQVTAFQELRATCAMRRFRVVVRVLD